MIEILGTSLFTVSIALFITCIYLVLSEKHKLETNRKIWIKLKEWEYEQALHEEDMAEWQASSGEDMLWNS